MVIFASYNRLKRNLFLHMSEEKKEQKNGLGLPTPRQIKEELDKFVIGQDEAKTVLSVAVYNHYKRILINDRENGILKDVHPNLTIDKSNIMLLGNTGTGKTLMVKTIARMLGVPCYIADTTSMTASGYVGDDVESCITGLLQQCDYNVMEAERGILVLDEIDKITRKGDNPSITRDVSGESVQQCMLKIVEGSRVGVPPQGGRKHPEQPLIYVKTDNILVIGLGAFDGLSKIIEKRLNFNAIGFSAEEKKKNKISMIGNIFSQTIPQDLKSFGFIPELIGRFPILTYTNDLTEDDLVRIITEPKSSILQQFKTLLMLDGVKVSFNDESLREIAKTALKMKIGARGLRSLMEAIFTEIMFNAPDRKGKDKDMKIDVDFVKERLGKFYMEE